MAAVQQQQGGQGQSLFGNANQQVTLYAQDGQTRQVTLGSKGELSFEDTQWLNQHGGAMPLNQVPVEERAFIRQTPESVAARRGASMNQGGGGGGSGGIQQQQGNQQQQQIPQSGSGSDEKSQGQQQQGQDLFGNANQQVTLYAQDGQTRQVTLGAKGELSQQDTDWLGQHGGALPFNQVPEKDRAFIRQTPEAVARRRGVNMDQSGIQSGGSDDSQQGGGNQQQQQQQQPQSGGGGGASGNISNQNDGGAANFAHANSTITLYAQDGQTTQVTLGDQGELLLDDVQWLNQHGGAMPLSQVPQQDKAFIRQNPATVAARRQNFQGANIGNTPNVAGQ